MVVGAGVIAALAAGGILFSFLVQLGGSTVRNIITPVVFIALLIFSVFLILDIDIGRIQQLVPVPRLENPVLAALLLGLAFGLILLPCNAASVAILLALAAIPSGFFEGTGVFLCFGTGMVLTPPYRHCRHLAGRSAEDPAEPFLPSPGNPGNRRPVHAGDRGLVPCPLLLPPEFPVTTPVHSAALNTFFNRLWPFLQISSSVNTLLSDKGGEDFERPRESPGISTDQSFHPGRDPRRWFPGSTSKSSVVDPS
jgi:hypothetical protein